MRDDEGARYLEIINSAIRGLATSHYTAEVIAGWVVPVTEESVSELMRNPDGEIRVVAELGGVPVGIGALVPTRSELRGCYVSPEAARQGCGSALVIEMERLARLHGVTHLELAASLNAEPFYAAHGYEVRERSDVVLTNGHRMPCVWMVKTLVVLVLLGLWCTPVAAQTWTGASVFGRWGQPHVDASSMGTEQSTPSARAAVVDPFSPSGFDAALGLGVATGVGLDAVPRSPLTMVAIDGTWWLSRRWGVAADYMRSLGDAERGGFGERDVQHASLRLRFRAPVGALGAVVLGIGIGPLGWKRFGPSSHEDADWGGGFGGEGYVQRSLTDRVAMRGGVSVYVNEDTTLVRPVVLAVLQF